MRDDAGFTLIELLVTIGIIAILAAIAFGTFMGQRSKAFDVEAKQTVSNLVMHLETCNVDSDDFRDCVGDALLRDAGFVPGTGIRQIEVREVARRSYVAVGHSATGAEFRVHRESDGRFRSCDPPGEGGCRAGASW